MSTQPVTVESDGYNITSTHETKEAMLEALAPKTEQKEPRVVKPIPDKPADDVSEHAKALGKLGGKAAAEARKAKEGEKDPEPEKAAEPDEGDEAKRRVSEEIEKADPEQKKKLASERVAEATRAAAEAKREAARERQEREALARRLDALERERARPAATPEERKPEPKETKGSDDDPEPQEKDYPSWDEYVKATGAHAARKEWKRLETERQAKAQHEQIENDVRRWEHGFIQKMNKGKEATPDLLERISPDLLGIRTTYRAILAGEPITAMNAIADEIVDSPKTAELMLYFSEHPNEFQRIATLRTPRDIAREMAKLEARLESATLGTPPSKPAVSQAKPPVRPVTASPHTADATPSDDDDYDEHVRKMNAREARNRR